MSDLEQFTPSQGPGPFYSRSLIFEGSENAVDPAASDAIVIEGRVLDGNGNPVPTPDALIEVLQGDQFARTRGDNDGHYRLIVRKPSSPDLPDGRHQAPFFHVRVFIFPLPEPHETRVYFPDEEQANEVDPLLSSLDEDDRNTLIARRDGDRLRWDINLSGDRQTAFLAPIGEPSILDAGESPSRVLEVELT